MASNRDILEAQRFNRRRLVTAFTSGTPGGRELEPRSPLRPLLVGGVLMLVMALVGLAAGRLGGSLPSGWGDGWVLFEKGTGDRFYTSHGVLHPLRNLTTAKLLADNGHMKSQSVSGRQLRNHPRGGEVGIEGAPEDVPERGDLRSDEWTSCLLPAAVSPSGTPDQGPVHTQTWVAQPAPGLQPAGESGVFVRVPVGKAYNQYFVAGGLRYPVANEAATTLGLSAPTTVSAGWIDLFPEGDQLTPTRLPSGGQKVGGFPGDLGAVGTLLKVNDGASEDWFIVAGDHQMARLDTPVERRLAAVLPSGDRPRVVPAGQLTGVNRSALTLAWPTDTRMLPTGQLACATLAQDGQQRTVTQLGWVAAPASGVQLPTTDVVDVGGGSGALVSAADTSGANGPLSAGAGVALVTDNGRAYALAEPGQKSTPGVILARLGYQESDVLPIPSAWVRLVRSGGVELSPATAQASLTP